MAERNAKRDTAKAIFIERKSNGGDAKLRTIAEEVGASFGDVRKWKKEDEWEASIPKRKAGAKPGNQNCKGHRNAAGHHHGPPKGNKNAEKDGAYSKIFFDMLSDSEKEIAQKAPIKGREALRHEMMILKVREHRILTKIAEYESKKSDELFLEKLMDMRMPGEEEGSADGAIQKLGMYSKDTAFNRVMKLDEALYKVQGRIATIANALRSLEESDERMKLERERLEIMRMRATGAVDVPDIEIDEGGFDETVH